jgi:hypothetical protein
LVVHETHAKRRLHVTRLVLLASFALAFAFAPGVVHAQDFGGFDGFDRYYADGGGGGLWGGGFEGTDLLTQEIYGTPLADPLGDPTLGGDLMGGATATGSALLGDPPLTQDQINEMFQSYDAVYVGDMNFDIQTSQAGPADPYGPAANYMTENLQQALNQALYIDPYTN